MKKLLASVLVTTGLFAGMVTPSYANRAGDIVGGVLLGGIIGNAIGSNGYRSYPPPTPVYNQPPQQVYVQPAPVYVQPGPVYVPAPGYYVQPAPRGYYEYGYRHHHHHRDYD